MPVLDQIFQCPPYSEAELAQILPGFLETEHSCHTLLLRAGETALHYWYLESGMVRSYITNPQGEDITTEFFAAGDLVIDWPSFMLRKPTRESFETLTDCRLWRMDYPTFQRLFHTIGTFREAGRERLVKSYFELKQKSVALIADSAEDRYRRLVAEKPQLLADVPLKLIAPYIGVAAPSLSRIRRRLAVGRAKGRS